MGGGESKYVEAQEKFVRENYELYKSKLPDYNSCQIKGKMRQLYAGSDELKENQYSYINRETWLNAKHSIKYPYATERKTSYY